MVKYDGGVDGEDFVNKERQLDSDYSAFMAELEGKSGGCAWQRSRGGDYG